MAAAVEEQAIFESIPWCRKILDDARFQAETVPSRTHKEQTREDALLAHTLKTADTIRGWVSLHIRPGASARSMQDESRTLLSLEAGLNGYARVCHGGIVATLLDEPMSLLVAVCRRSQNLPPENVTAYLHVTYLKPVPTPGVVVVQARVTDIKGRKYYVDGSVVDEHGTTLAKATGLFVCVQIEKL